MSYEENPSACGPRPRNPGPNPHHSGSGVVPGIGVAVIFMLLLIPAGAAAQTCIGSPAMTSQFTLGGYGAFPDAGTVYGVDSRSNLPGRVAMGARIGTIDLEDTDDNITSVGADVAFDLAGRGALSFCPVVGVDHDFWSGTSGGVDFDYSRWAFPAALAVGSRVGDGAGSATLIPSLRAGLLHQRFSGEASAGPFVLQRDGNRSDLFLDAGATVHIGPVYGRAGIHRIFDDQGDTVVRVGLGFVF